MSKVHSYALFQAVEALLLHLTFNHHTKITSKLNDILNENPHIQRSSIYSYYNNPDVYNAYLPTLSTKLQNKIGGLVYALKQAEQDYSIIKSNLISRVDCKESLVIKSHEQLSEHRLYLPNKVLDTLYMSLTGFVINSVIDLYLKDLKKLENPTNIPDDKLGNIVSFYFFINLENSMNI
jgi:hypothetical protein